VGVQFDPPPLSFDALVYHVDRAAEWARKVLQL